MNKDLISVVIPIYNVEKFLEKCIKSVIKQSYSNLEIILVNDGSTDNCKNICEKFLKKDKRIKLINKKNGGLSSARNAGIKKARGKYITFIDSDDYIDKNYVKILYDSIKKYNCDLSIASNRVIYSDGVILDNSTGENGVIDSKEALCRLLYDEDIDLSAAFKLYKLSLFDDINYPEGRLFEDTATTYKLIDKCDKVAINLVSIYNYFIRSNSITNYSFDSKKMDLIVSTKEMCDYIKNKYPDLKDATDRRLMYSYLSTLSQLVMSKEKFPKEEKILLDYIKSNGNAILKNNRVPKRDKIAIICLKFGLPFYKFSWKIYKKITGRKSGV